MEINHTGTEVMKKYDVTTEKWSDIEATTMIHKFSELIKSNQADVIHFNMHHDAPVQYNSLFRYMIQFQLRMQEIVTVTKTKETERYWEYKIYYKNDKNVFIFLSSSFDIRIAIETIKRKVFESEEGDVPE